MMFADTVKGRARRAGKESGVRNTLNAGSHEMTSFAGLLGFLA